MHKLIGALAVVSAIGFASSAFAAPVQLADNQLDQVTAGSFAVATAGGFAFGQGSATSVSGTPTAEGSLHINGIATADGAVGIAVSYNSATGTASHPAIAGSFATSEASSH